jgi:hypothetical protein
MEWAKSATKLPGANKRRNIPLNICWFEEVGLGNGKWMMANCLRQHWPKTHSHQLKIREFKFTYSDE